MKQAMTKDEQIKELRKALREAIEDDQRVVRFEGPDDDDDSFSLTWTDETKKWAKLSGLDLSKLSLDHYYHSR